LGGLLLLGLLGGGVVAAAVLLWENLDVRQLAPGIATDPGPLPAADPPKGPAVQPGSFQAVLLNSAANRDFYPDPAYYPGALEHWRALIEAAGGTVREISSVEELRNLSADDLLVVPEAPCLSGEEIAALGAHMDAGGGLVSNWAIGARTEDCGWRGWGTVAEITGASDVRELAVREGLYFSVPGGSALSPGLDPGTRIELRPEPALALHLTGPRVYWSDWALNPAPDESGGGADGAAVATQVPSGGRSAWFGFHLSQAATSEDSLHLGRLVQNGLLWAAGQMTAYAASWPHGRRGALLLVEDVEAEYQNAEAVAELLEELEVPGTFFAVSQLVLEDPELGQSLVRAGEVGSQTSDHTPVAGLTYQDQVVRLRRSRTEITTWTGSAPAGLRPPEEAFDTNTLRAWDRAGGGYVMAVNQARSASPEIFRLGTADGMVLLPRLIKDDYNVFVQEGALRADRLAEAFLDGMGKLRAIGGLAVIATHTQILGTGRRLDALRDVVEQARADGDWWIATGGEAAAWWAARAEVEVTIVPLAQDSVASEASESDSIAGPPRPFGDYQVLVQAGEAHGITGLWVDLVLPHGVDGLTPFLDGVPVSYSRTDWGIRVPVERLDPGQTRAVVLRRELPEGPGGGESQGP